MLFANSPGTLAQRALADVQHGVYWLQREDRPHPRPPLIGDHEADLVVVGAGFTGLWTAIEAKRRHPQWRVLLVEGGRIASGGSGRNGGFMSASLTHGLLNGYDRWPDELPQLLRLGRANLDEIESFIGENQIDADFRRVGEYQVAVAPHQVAEVRAAVELAQRFGEDHEFLDADAIQAEVHSPTYLAAGVDRSGVALMDPAKLAWGLARVAEDAGVGVYERTPVRRLADRGTSVFVTTDGGAVRSPRVALATNAYPPLLERIRHYVVPVYDYVLMTEPLTREQWDLIGWRGRQGIADSGNQFHYYRVTADGRILWGGFDAMYHYRNGFGPRFERDDAAYARLAQHFVETFPSLMESGLRFSHAWGGAIDTCTRFTAFWGRAHGGKTTYVVGFTGLGTGSSRFAAHTMLDIGSGADTERTRLRMVRTKPLPFPPEPVRSAGIALTTASLAQADRSGGRRNLWLRTLDALGLGFDS
jgi:glycine/D-amino acid oxidase-like deaminating enzyme